MRGRQLLVSAIAMLALTPMLMAQVSVSISQPAGTGVRMDDLWALTLNNSSKATYTVTLKVGLSSVSKQPDLLAKATSKPVKLPPGKKTVTKGDIEVKESWYKSGYEEMIQSGTLAAGAYQLDATVITEKGEEWAWDHKFITIAPPAPPKLVSPVNNTSLMTPQPVFEWTAPSPLGPDDQVVYEFRIFELQPGQTSEDAVNQNTPWYQESNIYSTSYTYPEGAHGFEAGKVYLWNVRATLNGVSLGQSEAWGFRASTAITGPDIGVNDLRVAMDLTMSIKVRKDLELTLAKLEEAKQAIAAGDQRTATRKLKEALKSVNDILGRTGKTQETTEFIDRLRSARRKLEAEIETRGK
ncbi:MAG: hypothetical protein ABIK62_03010 [candidate division WOR-3 bacterium]